MKFAPAIETEDLFARSVSENKVWEIGVHHVLFGHRIRVGAVGAVWCELDYCAGANQKSVELLYQVVKQILEKFPENAVDWRSFPFQEHKPVFTDIDCWAKLIKMAGDLPDAIPGLTA